MPKSYKLEVLLTSKLTGQEVMRVFEFDEKPMANMDNVVIDMVDTIKRSRRPL